MKNNKNSNLVNVEDIEEALQKSKPMAQRIMRAIRKTVGKGKNDLILVTDYAKHFNITEEEAKISLGRVY